MKRITLENKKTTKAGSSHTVNQPTFVVADYPVNRISKKVA